MARNRIGAAVPVVLAVGLYVIGVAVPLAVLYARVVAAAVAGGARAAAPPGPAAVPARGARGGARDLPPFDVYGADEAPAFPDLNLEPPGGGPTVRFASVVRGPAIVHLWSLGCETCADEWPALRGYRERRAGGDDGLPQVVSIVALPDAADPAATAADRIGEIRRGGWFGRPAPDLSADWIVVEDAVLSGSERPTADRPATGFPETFLLDADRRIRLRLVGPTSWEDSAWRHLVEMLQGSKVES